MKIFKDPDLKEEVKILDLGIVPAGESKEFTYYLLNDISALLVELKFQVEHEEVEIIKSPTKMEYLAKSELVLKWSPSVTVKQGLKTSLKVCGKELYR